MNCWFLGNTSISCNATFSGTVWGNIFLLFQRRYWGTKTQLKLRQKKIFEMVVSILIVTIASLIEATTDSNCNKMICAKSPNLVSYLSCYYLDLCFKITLITWKFLWGEITVQYYDHCFFVLQRQTNHWRDHV